MSASTFDPARKHTLYFRCGRDGAKTFNFVDGSGNPKDMTDYEFNFQFKQKPQYEDNVIEFLNADLVRPTNASVTVDITELLSTIPPSEYYWQMNVTSPTNVLKTWVTGYSIFHNGVFDGITESNTLTIYENGEDIVIQITDSLSGFYTRVMTSITSTATLTPDISNYDMAVITAQAAALTIANPTGTPANGNGFVIRIKDNGTARALTFGNKYRAFGAALPSTTTVSKTMYLGFTYNSADDKYDLFPSQLEQ
jgi:hypothetical protein